MKTHVAIIGGGGFGREVKSMLDVFFPDRIFAGFIDDDPKRHTLINETEVTDAYIAIADPRARKEFAHRPEFTKKLNSSLLHPNVTVHFSNSIGKGSIVCDGVKITTNVSVGEYNIINLNCVLGHDVVTGPFCSIMPSANILGGVRLGEGVFIGAGATVLQNVTVGDFAIVGAGSVITKDVPPGCKIFGVPGQVRS